MNKKENTENIGLCIYTIIKKLRKHGEEKLSKKCLSYSQFYMLMLLSDGDSHSMSELRKGLSITGSSITVNSDQLLKRGLITREYSKKDRRIVNAMLTEKGKSLMKSIKSERKRFLSSLLETLNTGERKTIEKAGEYFLKALNEVEE